MSLRAIENGFVFFRVTQSGYSGLYDAYGNQLLGYDTFNCPEEELEDCDTPCKHYPKCRKPHIISADIPTAGRKLTIFPHTYVFFEVFCGLCIIFEIIAVVVATIFLVMLKLNFLTKYVKKIKLQKKGGKDFLADVKPMKLETVR